MEHFAFPGNIHFADDQGAFSCIIHEWLLCCFIVCETMCTIGESRIICYPNDTERQAQQVAANLRQGRFSTETPLEITPMKIHRRADRRRQRSRENIA